MRTLKTWKIEKTDHYANRWSQVFYPFQIVINCKNREYTVPLSAGSTDRITVFVEGDFVYILNSNWRLGYVGLEEHKITDGELLAMSHVHWQSDYDFMAALEIDDPEKAASKFFDYVPMTQAKILRQYMEA